MRRKKAYTVPVPANDMAQLIFRKANSSARLGMGLIDGRPFLQWCPNQGGEEQGRQLSNENSYWFGDLPATRLMYVIMLLLQLLSNFPR